MVALAMVSGAMYGLADFIFSWNPLAAAPYLANRALPVFRAEPAYALGLAAEGLNGWLAAIAFLVIEPALPGSPWRRGLWFGSVIWAFWTVSAGLTVLVWTTLPPSLVAANALFGLPKCWDRLRRGLVLEPLSGEGALAAVGAPP